MDVEQELSAQRMEDEKISNRYVLKTVFIILAINFVFIFLNEVGLFYVSKVPFRICFLITVILSFLPYILSLLPKIIKPSLLKYIIIINVIIITLLDSVLLSFHATLIIFLPLIISTHYHSRKISTIGIFGTCFCALVSPLLSLKLGTFATDFLVYLVSIINPEKIVQSARIDEILRVTNKSSIFGITSYYAIPHFMITIGYGIIAYTVNRSKNESQQARVNEMKIVQDKIIYSMSNLIENRDTNTGYHVKRTSEVVRILVNELKKKDKKHSSTYWNSVINAAPMHDLGKISIPDNILQKPGKLTPEEFAIIKTHSQRSADIINQVLGEIESKEFLTIATNIARYHHEWFDGTGYPAGLKSEQIPYEARIMAIADVYDALVSKRCYKLPQTSEEAFNIIKESMGSHFDPALFETFEICYPKLIEYYQSEK